jgi:hypothetical protein
MDDPLYAVYSFVERAYVRLQAGDILLRCIEEGNIQPMKRMVEELVLAGPQGLSPLREVLEEVDSRQKQVNEDLLQVFAELEKQLNPFGMNLSGSYTPQSLAEVEPVHFPAILNRLGVVDEQSFSTCLKALSDTRELLCSLMEHYSMLVDIEVYLRDWMWGVIYQIARSEQAGNLASKNKWPL